MNFKLNTMLMILSMSISLVSRAQSNYFISSQIEIDRNAIVNEQKYVKNTIQVQVLKNQLHKLDLVIAPFRCESHRNRVTQSYSYSLYFVGSQIVELNAIQYHDISGNNGFSSYNVYLCSYLLEDGSIFGQDYLGEAEYFIND